MIKHDENTPMTFILTEIYTEEDIDQYDKISDREEVRQDAENSISESTSD